MLERASSTILEKGQFFCQRKQNVAQTGSMLVNCHITVARTCQPPPGVDRKFSPEKMFLWDPSFARPKSVRFGHGFKKNFDRKLICRFVLCGVLLFQVHLSALNRMGSNSSHGIKFRYIQLKEKHTKKRQKRQINF